MRQRTKRWPILAALVTLLMPAFVHAETPTPVTEVELTRYTGTWYEIARMPNRFQSDCARDTTATYQQRDDGKLNVINRCVEADGTVDTAKGIARIADPNSSAKLEVSFFSILGWRPIWGAYWILGLDPQYNWAVVGHPERSYGWILARDPSLSVTETTKVQSVLTRQGYDPEAFIATPQSSAE